MVEILIIKKKMENNLYICKLKSEWENLYKEWFDELLCINSVSVCINILFGEFIVLF